MPAARTRLTSRHKQIIAVVLVLAIFIVALVLWAGRSDDGATALPRPATTAPSTPGAPASDPSASPTTSGSGSAGTGSSTGLPALPGLSGPSAPNTTDLTTLGPGNHRVVLTARSDQPLLAVSYAVKGEAKGKVIYNVKSPVVIARTISGQRPYAAIGLQVGPTGTTGSCTITIDGKVVSSQRINAAYAVMQCLG